MFLDSTDIYFICLVSFAGLFPVVSYGLVCKCLIINGIPFSGSCCGCKVLLSLLLMFFVDNVYLRDCLVVDCS